jgi:hypothetical protein
MDHGVAKLDGWVFFFIHDWLRLAACRIKRDELTNQIFLFLARHIYKHTYSRS